MTINARHRKHYKAGSIWKPGKKEAADKRADAWFEKVKRFLLQRAKTRPI